VDLNADVIATFGGPASNAAYRATKSIPIVFAIVADPVAVGFVASLDRPGGNAIGITNNDPQQARLQLELLKSLSPGLTRVAILSDQDIPGARRKRIRAHRARRHRRGKGTRTRAEAVEGARHHARFRNHLQDDDR
jgi:hypothetical protein